MYWYNVKAEKPASPIMPNVARSLVVFFASEERVRES